MDILQVSELNSLDVFIIMFLNLLHFWKFSEPWRSWCSIIFLKLVLEYRFLDVIFSLGFPQCLHISYSVNTCFTVQNRKSCTPFFIFSFWTEHPFKNISPLFFIWLSVLCLWFSHLSISLPSSLCSSVSLLLYVSHSPFSLSFIWSCVLNMMNKCHTLCKGQSIHNFKI